MICNYEGNSLVVRIGWTTRIDFVFVCLVNYFGPKTFTSQPPIVFRTGTKYDNGLCVLEQQTYKGDYENCMCVSKRMRNN